MLLLACTLLGACGRDEKASNSTSSLDTQASSASVRAARPQTAPEHLGPAAEHLSPAVLREHVATVSGKAITRGMLEHAMRVVARSSNQGEVPEPPNFTACIAHLATSNASRPASQLKSECQKRYEALLSSALGSLIHAQWLIGEASEENLKVTKADVQREYASSAAANPEFNETLTRTGQTVDDVKLNLKLGQISDKIYDGIKKRTPKATTTRVESYYQQHKRSFALPEQRDLHIIRTASEAAAQKAFAEIHSGTSFSNIARQITIPQPIGTKNALLLGLAARGFSEPMLAEAIFRARPNVLSGPVKISLGYYVFEVTHIHPPHQRTLAEMRGALERQLPDLLHDRALSGFVTAFRRKWTARTDCDPGYVVENCRQFKSGPGPTVRDAYTF